MKQPTLIFVFSAIVCFFMACSNTTKKAPEVKDDHPTHLSFFTSDSIQIFGDFYRISQKAPTVLLFHQAGSNARGEYRTIAPRLNESGYNVLTIDQRSGGQRFGEYNRTIVDFTKNDFTYCDAFADLEGALNYVLNDSLLSGPKIIWGSSYSASLAIRLAAKYPEKLAGVLAFSPASGGPMQNCKPDEYFPSLQVPLLLLRPQKEMERESVQAQYNLAKENNHLVYTAENGVHGSSMLVEERTESPVDDTWKVVLDFLQQTTNNEGT